MALNPDKFSSTTNYLAQVSQLRIHLVHRKPVLQRFRCLQRAMTINLFMRDDEKYINILL